MTVLVKLKDIETLLAEGSVEQAEKLLIELLRLQPKESCVLLLQAKVLQLKGKVVEQFQILAEVNKLNPDNKLCILQLAELAFKLNKTNESAIYARQAYLQLSTTQTLLKLAKVFHGLALYGEMALTLKKVIDLGLSDDEVYFQYADSLLLCGQVSKAKIALLKTLEINSHHNLALANLNKVTNISKAENNISRLEQAVKRERNAKLRMNIADGLARELHQIGEYQQAFHVLTQHKNQVLRFCPFNGLHGGENVKALSRLYIEQLGKPSSEDRTKSKTESAQRPIFVVGMPRTGTTVVERILSNHKDVKSIGESFQFSQLLKQQSNAVNSTLVDALHLSESWNKVNFQQLGEEYLSKVSYLSEGNSRFVDKLPHNILLAGVIAKALPDAKIVCLVRNPLDTIMGNYRQLFEYDSGSFNYSLNLQVTAEYVFEFYKLVQAMQKTIPEQFMVVNYEELVVDPLTQSQRLFAHCDLEWDKGCIAIENNQTPVGTASSVQVQEPIHNRLIKQYKHYSFCLPIIEQVAKQYDYDLDSSL